MANLIDYRFFINEINVPNAKNNNPGAPIPNGGELETMITKHEPAFLEMILGYEMYKDLRKKRKKPAAPVKKDSVIINKDSVYEE